MNRSDGTRGVSGEKKPLAVKQTHTCAQIPPIRYAIDFSFPFAFPRRASAWTRTKMRIFPLGLTAPLISHSEMRKKMKCRIYFPPLKWAKTSRTKVFSCKTPKSQFLIICRWLTSATIFRPIVSLDINRSLFYPFL